MLKQGLSEIKKSNRLLSAGNVTRRGGELASLCLGENKGWNQFEEKFVIREDLRTAYEMIVAHSIVRSKYDWRFHWENTQLMTTQSAA